MKVIFYACMITLLVVSCNRSEKNTNEVAQSHAQEEIVEVSNSPVKTFEGLINNDKAIIMTFDISQIPITGTLVYKSVGERLELEGGNQNNQVTLKEKSYGSGKSIFIGNIEGNTYKGKWIESGNPTEYPFSLSLTNNSVEEFIKK